MKEATKYFRPFEPTDGKVLKIADHLMNEYLNMPDYLRTWPAIHRVINRFITEPHHVIWEVGDFGGILVFSDIVPNFQANLIFKIWNPEIWTHGLVRTAKKFIRDGMEAFNLVRLESSSPDPRVVKMAEMVGFEIEGMKKLAFPWGGKLYNDWFFAIIREPKEG